MNLEVDCAAAFSSGLLALAEQDERVCIVINDSVGTHHATAFEERFPDRVFDVGIAEQNMIGVALGLANAGYRPFVYSAACFLTARALEQIKVGLSYSRAPVVLCGFVSGLSYGALGGTHHALEDIAWMRALPDVWICAPGDQNETRLLPMAAVEYNGPVYARIVSKTPTPPLASAPELRPGCSSKLRSGEQVALLGTGLMSGRLLEAAALLSDHGIESTVLHLSSIRPLDEGAILAAASLGRIVVAEEHFAIGGLFGAVAEFLSRVRPTLVLPISPTHEYAPIGPDEWLREYYGLTAGRIADKVRSWLIST